MNNDFFDTTYHDLDNVVHSIARKVAKQYSLSWNEHGEDLVQSGWIGILRAKARYQPQGYKFVTYAWTFANGCIRREAAAITKRYSNVADLSEIENVGVDGMVDQIALKELLATEEGIALLADEMTDSKQPATTRRKQRANLRQAYEEVKQHT